MPAGTQLAVEGQPVEHLSYMPVARSRFRSAVGAWPNAGRAISSAKMTALTGLPATATVIGWGR